MNGVEPRHMYEVQRWLGLFRDVEPQGLHGSKRHSLVARHTRYDPKGQAAWTAANPAPDGRASQRQMTTIPVSSDWRWIDDAIAATYPRSREAHVTALLRSQPLSDRLWRWVYALMVTGGPILLPDLIVFLSRLTGPKDIADAEAIRRYQQWDRRTYAQ